MVRFIIKVEVWLEFVKYKKWLVKEVLYFLCVLNILKFILMGCELYKVLNIGISVFFDKLKLRKVSFEMLLF